MAPSSAILQQLLIALTKAKRDAGTLVLDAATLGATGAAPLLDLFSELQIKSFTLEDVQLPAAVTGEELIVSGHAGDVTLELTFADAGGEIAIEALFTAPATGPLQQALPALGSDFFGAIQIADATAAVTVPGVCTPLTLTSPRYGVVGLAIPSSGLISTSIAPRVDGQASPGGTAKGLLVEIQTASTGYRLAPLASAWTFPDLSWLLPGLGILEAFPAIIPTSGIGLNGFDLNLFTQAPSLSSLSLDVADIADPHKPLWTAAGGKVALTDVLVTLDLAYSSELALSLPGTGSVQGNFRLDSLTLAAQIPSPPTGVWSLTAYPDASLTVLDDIASLLDGGSSQLNGLLPAELHKLGSFQFTYIRLAVDASSFSLVELTFALESTASWPLIPDVVSLGSLRIRLTIDGTPAVSGLIGGSLQLPEGSEILLSFGRATSKLPWSLDAVSTAVALPSIGQLAQLAQGEDLGAMIKAGGLDQLHFVMSDLRFGMTISPTKLTRLGVTLQLADAKDPLTPALDWELIPGVLTLTRFAFGFALEWGASTTKDAFGSFVLNGLEFDVKFASQATSSANADGLIAEYSAQGAAGTVDIKKLVASIAPTVAAGLPDGLEIDLADAILAYVNTAGQKKFLFAMDIAVELPLSELPLVGKALPADAQVAVKNLKVVVASAALTANDVAFINAMAPKPVLAMPAAGSTGDAIPAGFSMTAELQLGELSVLMSSPPVPKTPTIAAESETTVVGSETAGDPHEVGHELVRHALGAHASGPPSDPVMWIPVQKTFGPVQIQKVGFSYRGGDLFVVSNLALTAGGLEIDLLGIGIGSPIKDPSPAFTIQGLAVSFSEGPISIMGGMLGTLEPLDFVGALSVRAPELSLSAFAGYAEYQGHPSFFLYGVLDAPIGGPPPFFVTGIAAGVGFNRKLLIPDVSGVATFPLVQWAQGSGTPPMDPTQPLGDQVTQALTRLAQSGVVAPSVGDYWFAAGVRFTSFEIVQSFALLTVSLGANVEIALLGLSTLTLPPDDPEPVAQVQLALEVSFSATKGLLAIAGQLTDNSYVLARACRLTGGFAFYLWLTGEHAGETVLTLGGYNSNFTVPDYYPVVPRVGLNWQVLPELSITGGLYFALTSNVVMAGGKLSAVWNSGPISAWFTYWADFLMTFSPFHYYIDGGIDLGAAFTVDLALFSVSVKIHVGVALELWGPPFAGRATVDLSIISFTILFNNHPADASTSIPWKKFVEQLLPAEQAPPKVRALPSPLVATEDSPSGPPAVVQINVISGLVRMLEPTAGGPVYLVTAEKFQCAVLTVIPSKLVAFETDPDPGQRGLVNVAYAPDSEQPAGSDHKPIDPASDFGAGPAGLPSASFQPKLTLSVSSPTTSILHAYRRFTGAPKALWENKSFDHNGVPHVDPKQGLTDSTIPNALTGLTLIPFLDRPDRTLPVPLESLLFTLDAEEAFAWSGATPPASDPFTDQTVAGTIATTTVAAVRNALLGALAGQGVSVSTSVDVSRLADPARTDLEAAPRLRLLGEPPTAA
jgi:hypothetical protein